MTTGITGSLPQTLNCNVPKPKINGKTIAIGVATGAIAIAICVLVALIIHNSAKKNKVKENCAKGLNQDCAKAVFNTVLDTAKKTTPIAIGCISNPLSYPCVQAVGLGYISELGKRQG